MSITTVLRQQQKGHLPEPSLYCPSRVGCVCELNGSCTSLRQQGQSAAQWAALTARNEGSEGGIPLSTVLILKALASAITT